GRASSKVTRGSTSTLSGLPLTFKVIGTAPGPTTFSAFTFWSSAATASTCAVAATAAEEPKVLRKVRREREKLSLDLVSLIAGYDCYTCGGFCARGTMVGKIPTSNIQENSKTGKWRQENGN